MTVDSIKKRYIYKLSTNLVGFIISIATAGMVPRALGVNNYGNFNFVTNMLSQLINLLDMRTSTCFYTRLSQNNKDQKLITFYGRFSFIIIGILILSTSAIIIFTPIRNSILPGQTSLMIYCCLLYVIITWLLEQTIRIMDARGLTVFLEKNRIINKAGGCLILYTLYRIKHLNLSTFFIFQYITLGLLIIIYAVYLARKGYPILIFSKLSKIDIKLNIHHFLIYTSPLALYVIINFFSSIFDRWILQVCGGSYEQGLYSFSFTFSNYCFIFVTALIPIFTRELSIASVQNEISKMAKLFRQYVPLLYAITAYFCCFIFIQAKELISIFGGVEYTGAVMSLRILAFYPLVSTYSNLNGSVIYANGRTNIFLKLTLFFTPLGIIIGYLLIAKFNMGAVGLSIKNISLEFISVCIILWINSKFLHLKFFKFLLHMLFSVIPFFILCITVKFILSLFSFFTDAHILITFFLNGFLYTILTVVFIYYFPQIIGLNKNNLKEYLSNFKIL